MNKEHLTIIFGFLISCLLSVYIPVEMFMRQGLFSTVLLGTFYFTISKKEALTRYFILIWIVTTLLFSYSREFDIITAIVIVLAILLLNLVFYHLQKTSVFKHKDTGVLFTFYQDTPRITSCYIVYNGELYGFKNDTFNRITSEKTGYLVRTSIDFSAIESTLGSQWSERNNCGTAVIKATGTEAKFLFTLFIKLLFRKD